MKRVITAIGNEKLNIELKKENNIEIICKDIQYKEGILEILEKNKNIDIIILSEIISGKITIKELIEKINKINSKIEIIMFLENKNEKLESYLNSKNINNIFYNNEIKIKEIINKINNISEKNIIEEIENLKKIIYENNIKYKNKNIKEREMVQKKENKVICLLGTGGIRQKYYFIKFSK